MRSPTTPGAARSPRRGPRRGSSAAEGIRLNLIQLVSSKLQVKANTNLVHSLTKRGISNNDNVNITPYFVIGETPSFFDQRPVNGVYPFNPFTFGSGTNLLQTLGQFQA